ncbi:nuclear transport factor 2 family protein [Kribbella sp. CA-245084]|uniref:nuclear transport factor 2 family protein n=1 Tax=Kribbella sp. CA-245084 TaxID=3239940 RepID=UPI003D8A6B0E
MAVLIDTRVSEAADRSELRDLVYAYAQYADSRDADRFVELFLPDGELRSAALAVRAGRAAIRAGVTFLQDPPPFAATYHLVANHRCEVDGDAAVGTTYCIAHHLYGFGPRELHVAHLIYADEYQRTRSGWRFASRTITQVWTEIRDAGQTSAKTFLKDLRGAEN